MNATPAQFYAEMILTYMRTLPGGSVDQMVDVQMALGLSDDEMETGLRCCVERGWIDLRDGDVAEAS
jgi:hypothetical protein